MDYTSPMTIRKSGFEAFEAGLNKGDCPISRRTGMNNIRHWEAGWQDAKNLSCKGDNCRAIGGVGHSIECEKEHESTLNQQLTD